MKVVRIAFWASLIALYLALGSCSDPVVCGWDMEPSLPFYNATATSVKVIRNLESGSDSFLIRREELVFIPVDMNKNHVELTWFHLGERKPLDIHYELEVDRNRKDPRLIFKKLRLESDKWLPYLSLNGFHGSELNELAHIEDVMNCNYDQKIVFNR